MRVVRVEEITKLVGMDSYIASLSLNHTKLKQRKIEPLEDTDLKITYTYENEMIQIVVSKEKFIRLKKCTCQKEHCGHIALAIKDTFTYFDELKFPKEKDRFQEILFQNFTPKKKKTTIGLEVELRQIDKNPMTYEVNLKIGLDKKYSLKKVLIPFLLNYQKENYEISLGKYFTFDTEKNCFSKQDEKILHFIKLYIEMKERGGFYSFYQTSPNIILKEEMILEFLKLLKGKTFKMETMRQSLPVVKELDTLYLPMQVVDQEEEFTITFEDLDVEPITSDYTYVIYQNQLFHISHKAALFLKTMIDHERNFITITKDYYKNFANDLYLILNELNPEIKEQLSSHFLFQLPHSKFYFEKKDTDIVSFIKLQYVDEEINILSPRNYIGNTYVIRDFEQEQSYIEELEKYGFQPSYRKGIFTITDPEHACEFLKYGLKEIVEKHDTYVSNHLKKTHIFKKSTVKNMFQIGTDGIMSYQFSIDGIERSEMKELLKSVKQKKKYYKMKSGDYLSLQNNDGLNTVLEMQKKLSLDSEQMEQESIAIPKYQSLKLSDLSDLEYYKIDQSVSDLIHNFETFKNQRFTFTEEEEKTLREYQKVGVQWLYMIAKCEFGGILADEMGLGKSIQTITYIKHRLQEEKQAKMLIIVPTSLLYNWEDEFQKFGKEISIMIVNDIKAHRLEKLKHVDQAQVIITSYGLLRQDIEVYEKMEFDTMILDEAQNIKNPKSDTAIAAKKIKARVKFALTGTPLENSIYELWSIVDFIMPGYLGSFQTFKEMYPITDLEETSYMNLKRQIDPFILRRKKKDVLKDLPEKLENKVYVELNEAQKELYLSELEKAQKEIQKIEEDQTVSQNQFFILSLLTRLRQICIDPSLIFDDYHGGSSKFDTLLPILEEMIQNQHKILLFSQFPSVLKNLMPHLDAHHIRYLYLDGSTKAGERMQLVKQFHQDDTPVFLISLKAGGTGLNLTIADEVIHLDPWWNPQVENQATDRTHRIGQTKTVEVIKLISIGTIEEKIIALQEKKRALSDMMIEGEQRSEMVLSKLSSDELLNLFR